MPKFRYNNGAERVISERDARILTLLKKGSVVVDAPKDVEVVDLPKYAQVVDDVDTHADKPKRTYKRKDMKAEG